MLVASVAGFQGPARLALVSQQEAEMRPDVPSAGVKSGPLSGLCLWIPSFRNLAIGEGIASVLRFAALIWVTRTLGPAHFGVVSVGFVIGTYLGAFAHSGLDVVGTRRLAGAGDQPGLILGEIVGLRLVLALGFYALTALVALAVPADHAVRLMILGFALGIFPLALNVAWSFVAIQQTRAAAFASVLSAGVYLAGVVISVRSHNDLFRVPFVHLLSETVLAACLFAFSRNRFGRWRPRLVRATIAPVLASSVPISLAKGARTLMISCDVLLARLMLSATPAGQYAAASRIAGVGLLYLGLYYNTFLPSLVSCRESDPAQMWRLVRVALRRVLLIGPPVAFSMVVAAPVVMPRVLGPGYIGAVAMLQVLIVSLLLLALTGIYGTVLLAHHKQSRLMVITVVSLVANVAADLVLLPVMGAMGAAIATVGAEGLRLVLTYVAARPLIAPVVSAAPFAAVAA